LNAATNGALRILMACRHDRPLTMSEMTRHLGLTQALVIKTCNELMRAGVLAGQRGRGGGYRLARPASSITAMEIIDLFEAKENLFPCRLGQSGECRILSLCKLRLACEKAHAAFRGEMERLTVADLALEMERPGA
jgi:Rrf2 family nitric oxide-sensitive transcriptional repressor